MTLMGTPRCKEESLMGTAGFKDWTLKSTPGCKAGLFKALLYISRDSEMHSWVYQGLRWPLLDVRDDSLQIFMGFFFFFKVHKVAIILRSLEAPGL